VLFLILCLLPTQRSHNCKLHETKTNSNQHSSETQGDYKIWITNPAWMKWCSQLVVALLQKRSSDKHRVRNRE